MRMLVFYRSRECTNAIASSTMTKLKSNPELKGLEVEFINLDKRSYVKVLKQMDEADKLPKYVYIWYDEEKVTDYINETYPSIEVIHFNMDTVKKKYEFLCSYGSNDYQLINIIVKKFKDNLVKREVYEVDTKKDYKIVKHIMDDVDIANSQKKIFETEEEAKTYSIQSLQEKIRKKLDDADYYSSLAKGSKKSATQLKSLLKKRFGCEYNKGEGNLPF